MVISFIDHFINTLMTLQEKELGQGCPKFSVSAEKITLKNLQGLNF